MYAVQNEVKSIHFTAYNHLLVTGTEKECEFKNFPYRPIKVILDALLSVFKFFQNFDFFTGETLSRFYSFLLPISNLKPFVKVLSTIF